LSFLFKYKNKLQIDDFDREYFPTKTKRPIVGPPPILIKNKQIEKHGKVKYRVRPEPDPNCMVETEWLTGSEIEEMSKKESTTWIDIGSGKLARIFFEVISCDGLPSLDKQIGLQNTHDKPDAFVSIVYEDSVIFSDVIDSCSSPRFMPWSRRAFIFHMMHPSSQINLGVFNHNFAVNHDFMGRLSIDITNLSPNLTYDMKYNLKTSANVEDRKSKGFINVRFRIEYNNEYNILMANVKPPPEIFVNVHTTKERKVVRETCFGNNDMNIRSYISELKQYSEAQIYVVEALKHVLLWRNTLAFNVKIPTFSSRSDSNSTKTVPILLPFYSIFVFVSSVLAIEKPHLAPSILFAWIAAILKSTSDFLHKHPNPWFRKKTIAEIMQTQLPDKLTYSPRQITSNENREEIEEYSKYWNEKIELVQKKAIRKARLDEEISKENEDLDKMIADSTKKKMEFGSRLSSLEDVRKKVQKLFILFRFIRNVLLWEESYFSFMLFIGSITLSIVFLIIPWQKILLWMVRIIVWTILVSLFVVSISFLPRKEIPQLKEFLYLWLFNKIGSLGKTCGYLFSSRI